VSRAHPIAYQSESQRAGESSSAAAARSSSADALMRDAVGVIDAGRSAGVTLRLTGGLAVKRYCTDLAFVERAHSDIDLIGLSSQGKGLRRVFAELGYLENAYVSQSTAGSQVQFLKRVAGRGGAPTSGRRLAIAVRPDAAEGDHVDIFVDVMRMDHDIDVRGRLEIDPYAVSPADILAVKLQIGRPAEKDIHDVVALLKDLPLSDRDDASSIHVMRLARLCARDWGLYHDVSRSLAATRALLDGFGLGDRPRETVLQRIGVIEAAIDGAAKSIRWRLRARAGTRLAWRREVEEREGPPTAA